MGGRAISSDEMRSFYSERSYVSTASYDTQVFKERKMVPEFDPSKMKLPREALDSALSPHSRGIILAEDVTGSMGRYLLSLFKEDFPRLITKIYDSVSYNPHVMFMGVGDVEVGDEAPLQVTQFETDLRMLEQLEKIYIEKGGGSNPYESYILPWYFAGKHVKMDCWEKRGEKGFLFTFGDEEPTPRLTAREIKEVFGDNDKLNGSFITGEDCLEMASEKFHCYHIILGSRYVEGKWRELLGSHVCVLSDHSCLPELIVSILKMYDGKSKSEALNDIQDMSKRRVVMAALAEHEEHVKDETKPNNADADFEVL